MNATKHAFNEAHTLHELKHYLPAQAPLKDFIHHNTLHAFQHLNFSTALKHANDIFGYKTRLSLQEYRNLFFKEKIDKNVFARVVADYALGKNQDVLAAQLLTEEYPAQESPRIGRLRRTWRAYTKIDLDNHIHPLLFRVLCSYLDQGIAIWEFPETDKCFLAAIAELERHSKSGIFNKGRAKEMLLSSSYSMESLLQLIVGDEAFFNQYLFDQQFAHQGWSGMVAAIEANQEALLNKRAITLKELIIFELLLELDTLDSILGKTWKPLCAYTHLEPIALFSHEDDSETDKLLKIWQEIYEWSYYDEVLAAIHLNPSSNKLSEKHSFQAIFCIDDRECSIRRHVERLEPTAQTFGTPGFFGVEFYYQPEDGKFITKVCPAPVTPKHLIKETGRRHKHTKDVHLIKGTHSLLLGWLLSQTMGFWSFIRLFNQIFNPSITKTTATAFHHMDGSSDLTIEYDGKTDPIYQLQIGFTVEEMTDRMEKLLMSIGLTDGFAPLVYIVGHGASSVNNPHYAAYDCGACSGRPGSVNARVAAFMANHKLVRKNLAAKGIVIPETTVFVAGLHDTTRDEMAFYDEQVLNDSFTEIHNNHKQTFNRALQLNAKERSRRFDVINTKLPAEVVHKKVKSRSVSLFEPRPELNHATNAICIIGRRSLTTNIFLDRRAFMNSYNYAIDQNGKFLLGILNAAAPVCGGINLEYYFSRVDYQKLGAGTKLPHNVMGLIGVANGIDGDLRPGLPTQMTEVHDPIRLMMIVEHYPDTILHVLKQSPPTYEWFLNEWVHLVAIHPDTKACFVFKQGRFYPYEPLHNNVQRATDLMALITSSAENIPTTILNS